jgi:GTP-binding protein EngB required for normal cell division
MTQRTKAWWLCGAGVVLVGVPYIGMFGLGSVWMWRNGLMWCWAFAAGLPTILGLLLLESARRVLFAKAAELPHPPAASAATGSAAREAVQAISQRLQTQELPFDQPDGLEKTLRTVVMEVLDAVGQQYFPGVERPASRVPIAHIAAMVELVARDFRLAWVENVPNGNTITSDQLQRWKEKGKLGWQIGKLFWQLNRVWRLFIRPGSALLQELHDHAGQNVAAKSVDAWKLWAVDYCVTKIGDYAIQLYSGEFLLQEEAKPRVSPPVERTLFDEEPLQVLVVGQVSAGKSSLINALLGKQQAPVDALPATDHVDLYECQPGGLPPMILRDTPGYGAAGDDHDAFSVLQREIDETDVLLFVCSSRSAARQADRELLGKIHVWFLEHPKRILPPIIYVLTHIDTIAPPLVDEACDAVAGDFGIPAQRIVAVCGLWGKLANLERLEAAILDGQSMAEQVKIARCLRQIRREKDEDRVFKQIIHGLRLAGGWMIRKK